MSQLAPLQRDIDEALLKMKDPDMRPYVTNFVMGLTHLFEQRAEEVALRFRMDIISKLAQEAADADPVITSIYSLYEERGKVPSELTDYILELGSRAGFDKLPIVKKVRSSKGVNG